MLTKEMAEMKIHSTGDVSMCRDITYVPSTESVDMMG